VPCNDNLYHTIVWHFNAFSGTQLIFSRAGPSAAFLWVPFLSPPKEMEQIFAGLKWLILLFFNSNFLEEIVSEFVHIVGNVEEVHQRAE